MYQPNPLKRAKKVLLYLALSLGLVVISAIYLLRGLFVIPSLIDPQLRTSFNIWSSLIVLGYGVAYALGTWKAWTQLSPDGHKKMEQAV